MWNYRIIKDGSTYGIYEVIYNDDGKISAHDENPTIVGESVDDLITYLEMMLSDTKKYKDIVLEHGKIKFAPLVDEDEELIEIKDLKDFLKDDER
jgi:argonaute-like protein implicated in RNA metabolism and viral defense